jgi:hypothetical protein
MLLRMKVRRKRAFDQKVAVTNLGLIDRSIINAANPPPSRIQIIQLTTVVTTVHPD